MFPTPPASPRSPARGRLARLTRRFAVLLVVLAPALLPIRAQIPLPIDPEVGLTEGWVLREPLPIWPSFRALATSADLAVAVGERGHLAISADGVNWDLVSTGVAPALESIAHDPTTGAWVAVGGHYSQTLARYETHAVASPDGLAWTATEIPLAQNLRAIAFGADRFVSVGNTAQMSPGVHRAVYATSTDGGTTWQTGFTSSPDHLVSIACGPDRFVAVGSNGALHTSTDGFTWQTASSPTSQNLQWIGYVEGRFIATTYNTVFTSADGLAWQTQASNTHPTGAKRLLRAAGRSVWTTNSTGRISWSDTDTSWTSTSLQNPYPTLSGLAYFQERFIAVGTNGIIQVSPSAESGSWTQVAGARTPAFSGGVAYKDGLWLAVGSYFSEHAVQASHDGRTWHIAPHTGLSSVYNFGVGLDRFVAVGRYGLFRTSTDGITWNQVPIPDWNHADQDLGVLGLSDTRIVAARDHNIGVLVSTDGLSATRHLYPFSGFTQWWLAAMSHGDGRFVTTGSGFHPVENRYRWFIFSSTDGETWTESALPAELDPTNIQLAGIAHGGGRFVITNNYGQHVLTSDDGLSWELRPTPVSGLGTIVHDGSRFIATREYLPEVWTSLDGETWVQDPALQPPESLAKLHAAEGMLVGLGSTRVYSFGNPSSAPVAPVILRDLYPTGTFTEGAKHTLTVTAKGGPDLAFQWFHNNEPLTDSDLVAGSTSPALTFRSLLPSDAGAYHLVITGTEGTATSTTFTLTVTAKQDQTITFPPLAPTFATAPPLTPTVSASSGLAVRLESSNPAVVLARGTVLTFTGVPGTAEITAYQSGDTSTWRAANPVTRTLVVESAPTPPTSGNLWAMGHNDSGQLGDGTTASRYAPVPITSDVVAVYSGYSHTMILKDDASLWATGANNYGQLGEGAAGANRLTPVEVATDVAAAAVGSNHTMILKTDGSLWAVGSNTYGQLGDGSTTDRSSPVEIATAVAAVSAGADHTMILKSDGTLIAFGRNNAGQLGDGTLIDRPSPTQIATHVAAVSAGGFHTLFLKTDGTLWGMGSNTLAQLGDGTLVNKPTPVQISTGVAAVAAGRSHHTLIIRTDGTLWATGMNYHGAFGDGTTNGRLIPHQVGQNIAASASGYSHSLVLTNEGALYASGLNFSGQLGDGTNTDRLSRVLIAAEVLGIAAGESSSFFIAGPDYAPPAFTSAALDVDVTLSAGYSAILTASGDPAPGFSVASGSLPPGLSLAPDGTLSGTIHFPIEAGTPPTTEYTGTFAATNSAGSVSQPFRFNVRFAPVPQHGVFNSFDRSLETSQAIDGHLVAYGNQPPTFSVFSGALPPGITLNSDGTFSGTATATGTYTGSFLASNALGEHPIGFTISVSSPPPPPVAPDFGGGAYSADLQVNTPFSDSLSAGGSPDPTYSVSSGALPPGLTLSSSGGLSGTPTSPGTYTGVFTASNGAGSSNRPFTFVVAPEFEAPVITSSRIDAYFAVGTSFHRTLVATGRPAPTFVVGAGSLPPGIDLSASGVLSGTFADTGNFLGNFAAQNSRGENVQTFAFRVGTPPSFTTQPSGPAFLLAGQSTFLYAVLGGDDATLQWLKNDEPIPGATFPGYGIVNIQATATYRLRAINPYGTAYSDPVFIEVRPPHAYDAWNATVFDSAALLDPLVSGPAADPDGDGLPNLLEYALGASPTAPDASAAAGELIDVGSDRVFRFTRPVGREGLAYTVMSSPDLDDWTPRAAEVVATADGRETVEAALPAPAPRLFVRLKVEIVAP